MKNAKLPVILWLIAAGCSLFASVMSFVSGSTALGVLWLGNASLDLALAAIQKKKTGGR